MNFCPYCGAIRVESDSEKECFACGLTVQKTEPEEGSLLYGCVEYLEEITECSAFN